MSVPSCGPCGVCDWCRAALADARARQLAAATPTLADGTAPGTERSPVAAGPGVLEVHAVTMSATSSVDSDALAVLRDLVAAFDWRGYMTPEQQHVLWRARRICR